MDTQFAKIVSDLDGKHSLLIEGRVIALAVENVEANNEAVEAIVRGLRARSLVTGMACQQPA